jgi:YbbR domain-containing protein
MNAKNYIFNNVGLKFTALFLALFVWVMISGKERSFSERTIEANVEYFNVDANIGVSSVRPNKVRLTVRGTTKELQKIIEDDFKVKIDLVGVTEETRLNYFSEDYLHFPEGMTLMSVYPRMIEINVQEFITKEVSIRVRYKGNLKPGIVLLDRQLVPEKVRIFGYKSQLSNLNEVVASEWVNLEEIKGNQKIRIPLKKSNEILKFENSDSVEVIITAENKQKEIKDGNDDKGKKQQ